MCQLCRSKGLESSCNYHAVQERACDHISYLVVVVLFHINAVVAAVVVFDDVAFYRVLWGSSCQLFQADGVVNDVGVNHIIVVPSNN